MVVGVMGCKDTDGRATYFLPVQVPQGKAMPLARGSLVVVRIVF